MLHLPLRDKVRHTEIRKRTEIKDTLDRIKASQWKWVGHLSGTEDNRWTKRL